MCGIVGYVGNREASPIILSALRRLEYRGYDSAGIAGIRINGSEKEENFQIRRCEGSIDRLKDLLDTQPMVGTTAIGHTRWATHGRPSEKNAHPHRFRDVVIVHNGIIENHKELRQELIKKGHRFESETDSEIIAHLLDRLIRETGDFEKSCRTMINRLQGAFALAVLWSHDPDNLFVAKQGSPLLLGRGDGENFVASDIPALLEYTKEFLILNDGEMAFIEPNRIRVMDFKGKLIQKKAQRISWSLAMAEKEGYDHFMLKEIHEQPRALQDSLRGRIVPGFKNVVFDTIDWKAEKWRSFSSVSMVACGTAWHAGLIAKYWMEQIAKIHADVDLASEYRYRHPIELPKTLSIAISQSGETYDTLAAVDEAKKLRHSLLSITNTVDSSIVRRTKNVIYTHAGPEISVASTKCFTAQLMSLALVTVKLAQARRSQSKAWIAKFLKDLSSISRQIEKVLKYEDKVREIAKKYASYNQYFYLGRGISFPIALEGALKLKEIAYINTQAYSAGEMKHGPIALISDQWPVVCVAPNDRLFPKMMSNIEVVKARSGKIISIGTEGHKQLEAASDDFLPIPKVREELSPFLTNIYLQLFAYHMAVLRGNNVDKPKNLAKSVTVE